MFGISFARLRYLGWLFALAAVFVAVSVFVERHQALVASVIGHGGTLGVLAYVFLTAAFVVFVIPLDIALLIPLGAAAWGAVPTALLSITGWTIGAAVAFSLARRYGAPVVGRMVGLERVRALEARIPKRGRFWGVAFLRMLVSVDLLSYALGLASDIPFLAYIGATALGVSPFGFYFAYAGTLPFWYRLAAVALALSLASFVAYRYGARRLP